MAAKRSISVRVRGRELRLRTDDDEETLGRVAEVLDHTLRRVEERTGAVDSRDVTLLAALNLAREVVELRDGQGGGGAADPGRLRHLIELAESALGPAGADAR